MGDLGGGDAPHPVLVQGGLRLAFITAEEAARLLGLTRDGAENWLAKGSWPGAYKEGGVLYLPKDEVLAVKAKSDHLRRLNSLGVINPALCSKCGGHMDLRGDFLAGGATACWAKAVCPSCGNTGPRETGSTPREAKRKALEVLPWV